MTKIHCDICGKEIKSSDLINNVWNSELVTDTDGNYIEDVCGECFKWVHCCINMMKQTGWRPDFHEKLESDSVWERDRAGYALEKLEEQTKLKLF